MINPRTIPVFKALASASLSLIPGVFFNISPDLLLQVFSLILIIAILFGALKRYTPAFYFSSVALGLVLAISVNSESLSYSEKTLPDMPGAVKGEITDILTVKPGYTKVCLSGAVDTKQLPRLESQKIILTIYSNEDPDSELTPGTEIYASCKLRIPKDPVLPGEFDEYRYARSMACNWVATSSKDKIAILGHDNNIHYCQYLIASKVQTLIAGLYDEKSAGIIEALLTGNKKHISPEIRTAFSRAGTAHLLAVSGLHTGFAAAFFFVCLGFVRNHTVKFILFSILLAGFVFLVGFAPSAVRAALMIELYLLGKLIGRKPYPINIASSVILFYLIINPKIILNISFQMSALSILGILILFPMIRRAFGFFRFTDALPRYVKDSLSLTFAASTVVSPLIAYYFGVWSAVSPLANLLALPVYALVLAFGFFSLLFSFIPALAKLYAVSGEILIYVGNTINSYAADLPAAYYEGDKTVFFALGASFLIIYIAVSKSRRAFLFRLFSGVLLLWSTFFLSGEYSFEPEAIEVYPREQYVMAVLPPSNNRRLVILADRKEGIYPHTDYYAEQYLSGIINKKKDTAFFAYTGNAGIHLTDRLDKYNIKKVKQSKENLALLQKTAGIPGRLHRYLSPARIEMNKRTQ